MPRKATATAQPPLQQQNGRPTRAHAAATATAAAPATPASKRESSPRIRQSPAAKLEKQQQETGQTKHEPRVPSDPFLNHDDAPKRQKGLRSQHELPVENVPNGHTLPERRSTRQRAQKAPSHRRARRGHSEHTRAAIEEANEIAIDTDATVEDDGADMSDLDLAEADDDDEGPADIGDDDDDLELEEEQMIIAEVEERQQRHSRRSSRKLSPSHSDSKHSASSSKVSRAKPDLHAQPEQDEDDEIIIEVAEFPIEAVRSPVTWSDSGDDDIDIEELEELFALADGEKEAEFLDGMWYADMSDADDDEDDSDSQEADSDGSSSLVDEQDIWDARHWNAGVSEGTLSDGDFGSDDIDIDDEDDGGNTTDSLDDSDHVGLVRFGIEVDEDELDAIKAFASLADVQAPTSAEVTAGLHRKGFRVAMSKDADTTFAVVDERTAAKLMRGLPVTIAVPNTNSRKSRRKSQRQAGMRTPRANGRASVPSHLITSSSSASPELVPQSSPRAPEMGNFEAPPADGSRTVAIIDNSSKLVPSPFSRKGRTRKRVSRVNSGESASKTETDTPSKIVSPDEASRMSPPPIRISEEIEQMDLDDVLDMTGLQEDDSDYEISDDASEIAQQSSVGGGGRGRSQSIGSTATTSHTLGDLHRWNRIPIGSYRRNMLDALAPSEAQTFVKGSNQASARSLFLPVGSGTLTVQQKGGKNTRAPSSILLSPVLNATDHAQARSARKIKRSKARTRSKSHSNMAPPSIEETPAKKQRRESIASGQSRPHPVTPLPGTRASNGVTGPPAGGVSDLMSSLPSHGCPPLSSPLFSSMGQVQSTPNHAIPHLSLSSDDVAGMI
ncbi:uncharacterized protein L969DRAFT_91858 [Mixia osmundae IAM 14324]|uniref:Uncharacterized protein n=1 Tax=Mixia osmundae (strain CBS 9802 / IAM 14324 / JCM 22182 / KY 12970) TaxID=764103 RepID=G7E2V2_MIXOS|nr:uncharacterized protein L969DRAFT_91858 [Mixia osmundae IAM 14324]KEI42414.1 hypothetical protein L969DRAFT_91858 [Mixia osmundae IAM 14324]GAA97296.1 hypothetical protein E5Q_03974 [Mixia osmundae IAM 14324]